MVTAAGRYAHGSVAEDGRTVARGVTEQGIYAAGVTYDSTHMEQVEVVYTFTMTPTNIRFAMTEV